MRRYDLLKKKGIIGMAVMLSKAVLPESSGESILENEEQDRWLLWLNEEAENEGQASYGLEGCEEKRKRGRPKKRG